ncbi:MAG: hypothetical protein U0269_09865 [Polyangiales bacterium]
MPSRPNVTVKLRPGVITPGSTFEAIIELEGARSTKVDAIEARFWGETQSYYGEASNFAQRVVDLVATDRPKQLPVGRYEMRVRFAVPPNAPVSYRGTTLRAEYTLRVHVDIPWWIDRVAEFTIPITAAPVHVEQRGPSLLDFDGGADDVRVECAIDRTILAPGSVLTGNVAFFRTREAGLGHVKLRLRCIERTAFGDIDGLNFVLDLPITRHVDGQAQTFRMKIPEGVVAQVQGPAGSTRWQLDVETNSKHGARTLLRFPLTLVSAGSDGVDQPVELPLIGDQWRQQMIARVARQCAMHFDAGAQRLLGDIDGIGLEIGPSSLGGTEAKMRWPHLGIGVRVGPSRWNDALSPHEIIVGHAAFDERYQVRGREESQVRALLALGADALQYLSEAQSLTIDDDLLTITQPDFATREESLIRFVRLMQAMTSAMRQRISAVPPASLIADQLEGWRSLAARYSARLREGDGAIERAELGAERLTLAHEFNGAVAAKTTITARLDPPIAEPPTKGVASTLRSEWASALSAIEAAGGAWRCTSDALIVEVTPAISAPDAAEPWISRVASASRVIQGRRETGPFR